MNRCPRCLLDLSYYPLLSSGICPNCGKPIEEPKSPETPVAPVGPGSALTLLTRFWKDVWAVIFHPTAFFSERADLICSEGNGLSSALAFAVIVQWISAFFSFIWSSTLTAAMQSRVDDLFRIAGDVLETNPTIVRSLDDLRQHALDIFFGAGAVILTPFSALLKLAFSAFLVHVAVRFFMRETPGRPLRYATTLKILAYSTAPWVFNVIPGIGILVAWVLAFTAAVIGLREVYRTTSTRAMIAMLFPELLFLTLVMGAIVILLFLVFNVTRLMF